MMMKRRIGGVEAHPESNIDLTSYILKRYFLLYILDMYYVTFM